MHCVSTVDIGPLHSCLARQECSGPVSNTPMQEDLFYRKQNTKLISVIVITRARGMYGRQCYRLRE